MVLQPWVRDPAQVTQDRSGDATTSSVLFMPWNPKRIYFVIVNDSDTVIYLSIGRSAAVNTGIRLNAAGGYWELDDKLQRMLYDDVYIIHGGAGNKAFTATEVSGR